MRISPLLGVMDLVTGGHSCGGSMGEDWVSITDIRRRIMKRKIENEMDQAIGMCD